MLHLVVATMMEAYGRTPPTDTKRKYAIGIDNLFESLKDQHTPTGHETFFEEKRNTGFLAARMKMLIEESEVQDSLAALPRVCPVK